MLALLKIEWLRLTRNKKYIFMTAVMPIVLFIVFSSVYEKSNSAFTQNFLMSMTTFCLTSFALYNFPFDIMEDKNNGWDETLQKVPLSKFQVTLVKIIKMTIESALSIILVFLAGHFLKNVNLTLTQWVVSGLLLLFGSTIFLSIGTLLTLFKDMQTASIFSNILYFGLAILGGLWVPINVFPIFLQKIAKFTPTYHFRELAVSYISKGIIPWFSLYILILYGLFFLTIFYVVAKPSKTLRTISNYNKKS